MQQKNETKETKTDILKPEQVTFLIPECCREGWDTCPHVVKRVKPTKKNIGL